jgi:hypothetical protein
MLSNGLRNSVRCSGSGYAKPASVPDYPKAMWKYEQEYRNNASMQSREGSSIPQFKPWALLRKQ